MAKKKDNTELSEKKMAENAYDSLLENFLPMVQKAAQSAAQMVNRPNSYEDMLLSGYYSLKEAMHTNISDPNHFDTLCRNSIKEGILEKLTIGSAA